jgi:hypothetical protein
MNELIKKRTEIIIKLNQATKKLEEEQTESGFIDKTYIAEVFKWNEELKKVLAEIDKSQA